MMKRQSDISFESPAKRQRASIEINGRGWGRGRGNVVEGSFLVNKARGFSPRILKLKIFSHN